MVKQVGEELRLEVTVRGKLEPLQQTSRAVRRVFLSTLVTCAFVSRIGCDLLGRVAEAIGGSQRKPL
jgi:hypothetical protein